MKSAYDDRIIPAYAGSTPSRSSPTWQTSDHPRIRGEHAPLMATCKSSPGSSPHTRGAQIGLRRPRHERDHPRIRGEHDAHIGSDATYPGSSPHTRGARAPVDMGLSSSRIIPAYAGSTNQPVVISAHHSDHPRIRGEHEDEAEGEGACGGSSPHTRGAPPGVGDAGDEAGIIPAYAGSTGMGPKILLEMWDHPRIRGEHCTG